MIILFVVIFRFSFDIGIGWEKKMDWNIVNYSK